MKIVLAALIGFASAICAAAAAEGDVKRGEALVTRHCAACHAVGRVGAGLHPQAPPFRSLGSRYPVDALEEALGEGIVSGHPDMPEFRFSGPDVGAIIAYLKSIQQR